MDKEDPMSKETELPPRTRQVKEMLDRGLTVRQIAIALGLSTQAVYYHVARLGGPAAVGLRGRRKT